MTYNYSYAEQLYLYSVTAAYNSSGNFVGTSSNEYATYQNYINSYQNDPDYRPVVQTAGVFTPKRNWFDDAFGPGVTNYTFDITSTSFVFDEGDELIIDITLNDPYYSVPGYEVPIAYYFLTGIEGSQSTFDSNDYEYTSPSPYIDQHIGGVELPGSITFENTNNIRLKVPIKADELREGNEKIIFQLFNNEYKSQKVSGQLNFEINDTSIGEPRFGDLKVNVYSSKTINEGDDIKFTITESLGYSYRIYWTFSGDGITEEDIYVDPAYEKFKHSNNPLTFSFLPPIGGNWASGFSFRTIKDKKTEGTENLYLKLFSDSALTNQIGNTEIVVINDTSKGVTNAPTGITLSDHEFNENIKAGTTVATISAIDKDSNDTHTFSFVSGYVQSSGNSAFYIDGNQLKIKESPDYEKQSSYTVVIKATDNTGLSSKVEFYHTLSVKDLEEGNAPTDWRMSNISFDENIPQGTVIATLSAVDKDPLDTHTFKFVESSKYGPDNKYFLIEGNQMKIIHSPDFETKPIYIIQFEAIDQLGLSTGPLWRNLFVNNLVDPSKSDDILKGSDGVDTIDALEGSDSITGGKGDDVIDGGPGSDTSIYSGKFTDYSFSKSNNQLKISDTRNIDGTDTLTNIEFLKFTDQTISTLKIDKVKSYNNNFRDYKFYNRGNGVYEIKSPDGEFDDITGIPKLNFVDKDKSISAIADIKGVFDQVTGLKTPSGEMFRLYNAAFARFPDADGLRYWIGNFSSGKDDARAVASSFLVSAEFKERYGANVTNAKYVETLYVNVLGRDYDQDGYNYWLGNLNAGTETRYELLLGFAESAENKTLFTEMTGLG